MANVDKWPLTFDDVTDRPSRGGRRLTFAEYLKQIVRGPGTFGDPVIVRKSSFIPVSYVPNATDAPAHNNAGWIGCVELLASERRRELGLENRA